MTMPDSDDAGPVPPTGTPRRSAAAANLPDAVAEATDRAGRGGSAQEVLLELQFRLGTLAALASKLTERGRRPFRPDESWRVALGRMAFDVYALADQTGVDLDACVREVADHIAAAAVLAQQAQPADWPFPGVTVPGLAGAAPGDRQERRRRPT